jgi:hypothetical protein
VSVRQSYNLLSSVWQIIRQSGSQIICVTGLTRQSENRTDRKILF